MTKHPLSNEFRRLSNSSIHSSPADRRRRGYHFERFLYSLLASERLEPSTNFRPEGEEIDGSFILDGRVILLEAKWHEKPLPASAIYAFKGKVDGKLSGTIGLVVSMSGYSQDATGALVRGKDLNVLLFDRRDIEEVLSGTSSLGDLLRTRLRLAAERGIVHRDQVPQDASHWLVDGDVDSLWLDPGISVHAEQILREGPCACDRSACVDHQEKVYCYFPMWLSEWVITSGLYWKCYDEVVKCARCGLIHARGHTGRFGICSVPYRNQRRQTDEA